MTTELQRRLVERPPFTVTAERDVSYMKVGDGHDILVVACDSVGGIGPKTSDTISVSGFDLGRSATRVPLLEVVAAGAQPVLVVDTLSVERHPTGQDIIAGVVAESATAGLGPDAITGSTEDNVGTVASGIGVTVIGRARLDDLRAGTATPPFAVLLLGRPMSAPADLFTLDHPEILDVPALAAAMQIDGVHEALPIGSHGVAYEFDQLAASANALAQPQGTWPVAANQSGGPSTAALLAVDLDNADSIRQLVSTSTGLPVWLLGTAV